MSQRNSEYARIERDAYETPPWVTRAVMPHLATALRMRRSAVVWEPCAGTGKMVRVLAEQFRVIATDIALHDGIQHVGDFRGWFAPPDHCDAIITNPPYRHASAMVDHALRLMCEVDGLVAMLLPVDWDSARGRSRLFADHPAWALKVVLTDRIVWVPKPDGSEAPSESHAWFVWDFRLSMPRTGVSAGGIRAGLAYAGMSDADRATESDDRKRRRARWRAVFGAVPYDPAAHDALLHRLDQPQEAML